MRRKRAETQPIPTVPDDKVARHEALEISSNELEQLGDLQKRVDNVTVDLNIQVNENHFIERLKLSYRRGEPI